MHEHDRDIQNTPASLRREQAMHAGADDIASLLDALANAEALGFTAEDARRIAASTAGPLMRSAKVSGAALDGAAESVPTPTRIAHDDVAPLGRSAPAHRDGVLARIGRWGGAAIAASVAVAASVLWLSDGWRTPAAVPSGGPVAVAAGVADSVADRATWPDELEQELHAWLASTVSLDAVAVLVADQRSGTPSRAADSLDELETDLASFWAMGSGLTREAGSDMEGWF